MFAVIKHDKIYEKKLLTLLHNPLEYIEQQNEYEKEDDFSIL